MNKICIVNNDIIPCDNNGIIINNNEISFLDNGNYIIEYLECNNINLVIKVNKDKCINLFEYSYDNDININQAHQISKSCKNTIYNKFPEIKEILIQIEPSSGLYDEVHYEIK